MSIIQQLREAVAQYPGTRKDLAIRADMHPSALHRFRYGERGLSTDALDRLADALDLELQPRRPARSQTKRKRSPKPKR